MKQITNYFKALAIAALLIGSLQTKAQLCAANFSWSNMANGVVTFTSTSVLTNSATTYYWNFGNNTTFSATGSAGMWTTTTYTANGTYVVTLFIMSIPTCSSGIQYTITINNSAGCALNANFNYTQGSNGLVNFNNTTTGTSGTTYSWNYGDNTAPSILVAAPHTFSANGAYTVTLVATNNSTCTSTKTLVVNVTSYCNIQASFTSTQMGNGVVNFVSTSTGTNPGVVHSWNFGNGSLNNAGPSVFRNYVNGTYQVMLTVSNSSIFPTCIDTAMATIVISSNTCNVSANFTQTVGTGGVTNFNSTSTGTTAGSTYTWNFGNGFTSNLPNPTVTYPSGGIYNVSLIVRNASNCTSTITKTVNVNTIPCVANSNFTLVPTNTPQYWTAIPAYPWNVTNAQWSWGDGTTTTFSLYASHQYSAAGMYNICLTVTVSCGATASTCTSYSVFRTTEEMGIINVNVEPPVLQSVDSQNTTGLGKLETGSAELYVFPNPNNGVFTVKLDGISSTPTSVLVYNLVGDLIYSSAASDSAINVSLPGISNGIYFVTVKTLDSTLTRKIVINN